MDRLHRSIWTALGVICLVGAGVVVLLLADRTMPW